MRTLLVLVLCTTLLASAKAETIFYVSPAGSNSWSGTLPAKHGHNGPFATLQHALLAVANWRKLHPKAKGNVVIALRGGFYPLAKTVTVLPEDSGTPLSLTVIKAYNHEHPILSGGVVLKGFRKNSLGRWVITLPEAADSKWNFEQLWINETRRQRPRLPYQGYFTCAGALPPSPAEQGKGADRFTASPNSIPAHMQNMQDVEVLFTQIWEMARMHIQKYFPATGEIDLTGPTSSTAYYASLPAGNPWLLTNVKEALHAPGQWYLNRPDGKLTCIPMPGEHRKTSLVVAPRISTLLNLQGDLAAGKMVQYVVFKNLEFSYTSWVAPPQGYNCPQADFTVNAAVTGTGAQHCQFSHCIVSHTANWGMELERGCQHDTIQDCAFTDLGAGGIQLDGGAVSPQDALAGAHNLIINCLIAAGGRIFPAATGIRIGRSSYNTVTHCTIANFYYTGISVGWTWGYAASQANHNIVSDNVIERIGQGVLSDMGGIYLLGVAPGTQLLHNYIHNVYARTYGGWGIYFDEGTSEVLAQNNLVYKTKSGGLHQHYGENNLIQNNIFAYSLGPQIVRTLAENHLSFTFRNNIVLWDEGTLLGSNWSGQGFHMLSNLYWNTNSLPPTFQGKSLAQWQKTGQDAGSQIANPLFKNPLQADFHLPANSPAYQTGFKPFPLHGWGCALYHRRLLLALKAPNAFPTATEPKHF